MIDISKYERLTIDDWYKMNHHDWKDVVNEHNDLLAEIKDLRDRIERATKILCFDIQPENGPDYYLDLAHERSLQMSAAIDVLEGKE